MYRCGLLLICFDGKRWHSYSPEASGDIDPIPVHHFRKIGNRLVFGLEDRFPRLIIRPRQLLSAECERVNDWLNEFLSPAVFIIMSVKYNRSLIIPWQTPTTLIYRQKMGQRENYIKMIHPSIRLKCIRPYVSVASAAESYPKLSIYVGHTHTPQCPHTRTRSVSNCYLLLGVIHLWRHQEIKVFSPFPLSTWDWPPPLVDVYMSSTWKYTSLSGNTMAFRAKNLIFDDMIIICFKQY